MQLVIEVATEFAVDGAVTEQVVGNDQQLVRSRYDGFLGAVLRHSPIEMSGEIAIFFTRHRPRRLAQGAAQPAVAFPGADTEAFARTLPIAGTQSSPTRHMRGIRKGAGIAP
jgi:hypothetical protein